MRKSQFTLVAILKREADNGEQRGVGGLILDCVEFEMSLGHLDVI